VDADAVADEWEDTLQDVSNAAIEKAIKKARISFPTWPPTPGEFFILCQGLEIAAMPRITITQASEIANKRIQRLFPYKNKKMHFFVNDVYEYLRDKIYQTQNEHWDFAKCAIEDCYHFQLFDSARLTPWLCVKHEGN